MSLSPLATIRSGPRGLLSQERIELLLSWRRSGFSVHNRVFAHSRDGREFEALVRGSSEAALTIVLNWFEELKAMARAAES